MNVEQEQLVQLACDTVARNMFTNVFLSQFWVSMLKSYTVVANKAIEDECLTDDMNAEQEPVGAARIRFWYKKHVWQRQYQPILGFNVEILPGCRGQAIWTVMPFTSTNMWEMVFSKILNIKTNKRSRIDVEPGLRCCLSTALPCIPIHTNEMQ